jgi:hypothetical protein
MYRFVREFVNPVLFLMCKIAQKTSAKLNCPQREVTPNLWKIQSGIISSRDLGFASKLHSSLMQDYLNVVKQ